MFLSSIQILAVAPLVAFGKNEVEYASPVPKKAKKLPQPSPADPE